MRSITRALTIGLLLSTAAPVLAQGRGPVDDFSERLGEAVANRLQAYRETRQQLIDGWCESRLARLTSLHDTVERYQAQISEPDLAAYRRALAQEWAYPCPPGGPPTPPQPPQLPPPFQRTDAYRQWEPVASQIAGDLYGAEQDRLAGDCRRRANQLRDAARRIDELTAEISRQGPAFGARFGGAGLDLYRRRLQEELARPCPPGATAPPPAQVATPPMGAPTSPPPAQGVTQEEADAVARQQSSFDSSAREQRESRERRAAAGSRGSIQLRGGYGESQIPRTNYGFVRDGPAPEPERPAALSERRIPVLFIEGGAAFRGIGRFNLGYAEGDARNRTDVAPSTTGGAQGVVGTRPSPSGSTGVAGNLGVSVDTNVSVREFNGGYRYIFGEQDDGAALAQGRVALSGSAGVTVNYRDVDHLGATSITRTAAPAISVVQALDQPVNELRVAAVVGAEAIIPLGTRARFTLGGEIGAYLYDYDGTSTESRDQNIGPLVDQRYDLGLPLSASGLGILGGFDIEFSLPLDYRLNRMNTTETYVDRFSIGARVGLELFADISIFYMSHVAQIINPINGDQVLGGITTRLGTDDAVDVRGAVGLRYYFN